MGKDEVSGKDESVVRHGRYILGLFGPNGLMVLSWWMMDGWAVWA
jgi:hypothetical protein